MSTKRKRSKKDEESEEEESQEEEEEEQDDDDKSDDGGDIENGDDNENDGNGEQEENDDESDNSDDDDEDDDDSEDEKSKKKRAAVVKKKVATSKTNKKTTTTKKKQIVKAQKAKKDVKPSKLKTLKKTERLEEARKAFKWWEAPKLPKGINWFHLEHAGIHFAPPYVPHGIPLTYDGQPVELSAEQEEIASFYAAMPLDGPQLGNAKTAPVFQKNFFEDFKEALGLGHVVKKFEKCDFTAIREHLDIQKSLRKAATDEEKLVKKSEKEKIMLKFGYALIDNRLEKMGNFNMEPPGLFRGRGEHPKTGKLKVRCFSESVSINLSEDACVPKCPLPGHAWHDVRHDPSVTWLCGWNENVQNQYKYVMLAASSSFKGKSDMDKYGTAIKLKKCISKVRNDYTVKIKQNKDLSDQQLGVAMWVIDILALRVGGEKGEDEADTVGCCSLRVEHLTFNESAESHEIELEFLGKDSMLYKQNIDFSLHGDLGKRVYACLRKFCKGKEPEEDVFETLNPSMLNKHLNSLMKGLTAKVFRTYNASVTLENELPSEEDLMGLSLQDKVLRYNAANRQVAILCNHQRTVSKATETMFENLHEKLNTLKSQRTELIKWKELASKGKESKIPLAKDGKEDTERIQAKVKEATDKKQIAKTNDEKLQAAADLANAKIELKEDQRRRFLEKHKYKTTPTAHSLENRIKKWVEDIRKMEVDIRNRDENKEVALGTSKINYMDPRISVAWCKRCEVPIDKVFAKTLRDKFNWAMAVAPDWRFE